MFHIVSVEEKQSAQEFQLFFSLVNMGGDQTCFNECSDSDIMAFLPFFFYHGFFTMFTRGLIAKKINGRVKISLLPSKLRFSAKCSFSRPNVHFSLSRGHYQPIYQPPEGVYLVNIFAPNEGYCLYIRRPI